MIPVGMAVIWAAYTTGIWGYCMIRGYDVTWADLFHSRWPGTGGQGQAKPGSTPPPGTVVPQGLCPPGYYQVGGPNGGCVKLGQQPGGPVV